MAIKFDPHMDMYDTWFKLNLKGVYINSPDPE